MSEKIKTIMWKLGWCYIVWLWWQIFPPKCEWCNKQMEKESDNFWYCPTCFER